MLRRHLRPRRLSVKSRNASSHTNAYWKRNVKEGVDGSGSCSRSEHVLVLRVDRRDEEVHSEHLKHREKSDQNEPGAKHLLFGRFAVQCAPDSTGGLDLLLLLFAVVSLASVTEKLV